jgi:hypothetical protein
MVFFLLTHTAVRAEAPQIFTEEQLAHSLQASKTCRVSTVVYEDSRKRIYCKVQFRGLEIEFADVNTPGGGTISLNSLGKNQQLMLSGQRCIKIIFTDADFKVHHPMGAHIMFKDDSTITYRSKNEGAWRSCEGRQ